MRRKKNMNKGSMFDFKLLLRTKIIIIAPHKSAVTLKQFYEVQEQNVTVIIQTQIQPL